MAVVVGCLDRRRDQARERVHGRPGPDVERVDVPQEAAGFLQAASALFLDRRAEPYGFVLKGLFCLMHADMNESAVYLEALNFSRSRSTTPERICTTATI